MEIEHSLNEITQRLQRDLNCLSDENRAIRKRALECLQKESIQRSPPYQPSMLQGLMGFMLKPLLKMLSDPVEKCRELAINILAQLSSSVEDVTVYLPLVMPMLVARLGTPEITEPSEELRLIIVTYLSSITDICAIKISPYLNDMVAILQRTLLDPYPEVKKESCACCSKLAKAIPASFHHQSETLAKPLLKSMTHQHSKVRLASIKAFGSIVRYGSPNPINDALPVLAQRACDQIPSVRSCLADVIGMLLLELPDRYSYHHKLIPLLLTFTNDDVEDVKKKSNDLWDKIGLQYESENEEDLKDKLDFVAPDEAVVPTDLEFTRPRLGCRVLVRRNFSKVLPAIMKDMTDWTLESRIKSSQLLFSLLYHMEDSVTHHIQAVISGLYKACQDDEPVVVKQSVKCAELIGFYVSAEIWCKLVLPAVRTSAGCHGSRTDQVSSVAVGPVQCTSCLQVLGGLIRGAKRDIVKPYLKDITACLSEPEVSQSEHLPLLKQLLVCIAAVVQTSCDTCSEYSRFLFTVILRVMGSKHAEILQHEIAHTMDLLAKAQNMKDTSSLYEIHISDILSTVKVGHKNWTISSPQCVLFSSLLSGAGPVIIAKVLDNVIPILTSCLDPDRDTEMRLHFITSLIRILLDVPSSVDSQQQFATFAGRIVTDIVVPNSVWKGGRTAAAIRTATMTCLQILLQENMLSNTLLSEMNSDLLPQVISCMDDDNQSTRLVSCKVLQLLLLIKPAWSVEKLHSIYPDLLRRMDDSSDEIRMATTRTLMAFISAFPDDYSQDLYKAHSEALYKGLLVHLDDPSTEIQNAVLEVLKQGARLNKHVLIGLTEVIKHKHRSKRYCEELLQAI